MTDKATISTAAQGLQQVAQRGAVLVLGNFDGVHLGHRALVGRGREVASARGVDLVAVTFFPPAKVLFGSEPFLSDPIEKSELLREAGADQVVIIPFDRGFAATPPERFAAMLADLQPTLVVIGEDFRFGRDRGGGTEALQAAGIAVDILPLVEVAGTTAKSSAIREALARADLKRAEELLGGPYRIRGEVEYGFQRGRSLGYPTLNVQTKKGKMLPIGVFAVRVDTPQGRFDGMANIGPRPTFPDAPPALEAHLFDANLDLYGAPVVVELRAFVREQQRFDGIDQLRAALACDEQRARQLLASQRTSKGAS
jgi:riboflavin kinase/FMN adenylyltransferase